MSTVSSLLASDSTLGTTSSTTTASSSVSSITGDEFLTLLVEQLKNQDPMNPEDSNAFVTQLSQLTSVEKLTSIDEKLNTIIDSGTNSLASYLGGEVTFNSDSMQVVSGNGGLAEFDLSEDVESLYVNILSDDGSTVEQSLSFGALSAGSQSLSMDGLSVADGEYQVQVTGRTASGTTVSPTCNFGGIVTGVTIGDEPQLIVNGREVAISEIKQIALPTTSSSTTSS